MTNKHGRVNIAMAETKKRRIDVRVNDETWDAALAKAHAQGVNVSGLVRNFLVDYVKDEAPMHTELGRIIVRLRSVHKQIGQTERDAAEL